MAFLGMRGTGDWIANARPESWRELVLYLFPNGQAPLTAIMSKMGSEKLSDPRFHWFEERLPDQYADITSVWTDAALTIPYNGAVVAASAGDVLYFQMSQAHVEKFRAGHQVLLRLSTDLTLDVNGKVISLSQNGANSYIAVLLLEDDDNSTATVTNYLDSADIAWIIGSIHEEGAGAPDSLMYDPVEYWNHTQIFRTPIEHTRTAMEVSNLRTGNQKKKARTDALRMHSIEIEKAFIFGVRTQRIGAGGKPERTTGGIKSFLTTNTGDFRTATGVTTWAASGESWLDNILEQMFRFGSMDKLCLCGSGALKGINDLVKARGTWEMTPMKTSYGIKVMTWVTPFGNVHFKTHPLFTYQASTRHSMLIVEPKHLKTKYITDTKYRPDIQENDVDGQKDEYLSELGLELHFEETHGWFDGVGLNP